MTNSFKRIEGGFTNVPAHLKTKTQLRQMGLKPTGEPVAEVWSYKAWVQLYDEAQAIPKQKPSKKQLEALEKARETAKRNRTCVDCLTVMSSKKDVWTWATQPVCAHCYHNRKEEENKRLFLSATEHFTRVAGTFYDGRQAILRQMTDTTPLFLERDATNPHDVHAIRVLALVEGENHHIGFLHRAYAEKFAPLMDKGILIGIENCAIVFEEYGEWIGDLWVDGQQQHEVDEDDLLGVHIRLFMQ